MRDASGAVYFLSGDHLGSTSLTTDISGTIVSEVRYLPYGQTRWLSGTNTTDFGFTSQRQEGFQLYDYNARMYSPVLGRFISPDSIVPDPSNGRSFNRYRYVRNNPLNYVDPTGHFSEEAIREYLEQTYGEEADAMYTMWQNDEVWWEMLTQAEGDDYLFGGFDRHYVNPYTNNHYHRLGSAFLLQFQGSGQDSLTGFKIFHNSDTRDGSILEQWGNLENIRRGVLGMAWEGVMRLPSEGPPSFPMTKQSVNSNQDHRLAQMLYNVPAGIAIGVGVAAGPALWVLAASNGGTVAAGPILAKTLASVATTNLTVNSLRNPVFDMYDIQNGDLNVDVGRAYFNFQDTNMNAEIYSLEYYQWGGDNRTHAP